MAIRALITRFGVFAISLMIAGQTLATTKSDIFINQVTPPTSTAVIKNKTLDFMPTIGNRRDVINGLHSLQARQIQDLAGIKLLPREKRASPTVAAQIKELELRRKFYDEVIFSVDSKWNDRPLREFLEKEFLTRAQNDIDADGSDAEVAGDTLWKFYTYMSVAIRDLPEPRENLVSFIQGYVEFSTISAPKPPSEYVAQRAYSNGVVSQAAQGLDQAQLGDGIERILKANGLDKRQLRTASGVRPPEIELRLKVDLTHPPESVQVPAPIQRN